MTSDFNIWDSLQNSSFPHHSSISDDLLIIADFFNLNLSSSTNQIPIRYSDNANDSNSIINLMFLQCGSPELDNHIIHLDWHLTSDHAPLTISIPIIKKNINLSKRSIIKDSKKKRLFIKEIISFFRNLNTSNLLDISRLEKTADDFANIVNNFQVKNARIINVTKHSKSWQDENCSRGLEKYKNTKNLKIQEITNKKQGPWELMDWINKHKLPAIEMIKYNSQPYLKLNDLWQALYLSFNTAQYYLIDKNVLNEIVQFSSLFWTHFLEEKFTSAIAKCNNESASGPNKLT